AAELLRGRIRARPASVPTVCDMCAGSGCIAIAVLRTLSDGSAVPAERLPSITAADISGRALAVARRNAGALLPERLRNNLRFVQSNLFENAAGRYDFILTNPPYVPAQEARALLSDGRGEPLLALDGDVGESGGPSGTSDGLAVIRRLVPQAAANLAPGGALLLEAGEYNAEQAAAMLRQNGFSGVTIHRDLAGQLRVVEGRR
ncbi:MAG: peptide chain release factor N(5)-glutamine methyltransferase, partial [Treponemataceae bacterium]|nr:peptide chain release factor N(5)-glutamine methyltransferase [Treponemataceae bacterium]